MKGMKGVVLKFGAFAAVTVVLTAIIGAQIAKIQFGDTYTVTAHFDDVTGLAKGDDVKLAGVKVGQVSGVRADDNGRAEVTLSIEDDVRVPTDSEAAIRWRNLLGQRVVYLEPGGDPEMLAGGDEIERTKSVVDIGALINELGGLVTAIDPAQLNSLMTAISGALDGNEARVGELLESAGSLLQVLADRSQTIENLLEDFDTVSAALASRDQQIRTMIENLAVLSETFAENEGLMDSTLTELAQYTTGLDQVLTTNNQDLRSIVSSLAQVTDTVRDNIGVIEDQLVNLPGFLEAYHVVTNRGEFFIEEPLCFNVGPPPCPTPTATPQPGDVRSGNAAVLAAGPVSPDGQAPPDPITDALAGLVPEAGS
jgi:phospholipid/cholesterol/gamma-HCH transport system substrate-binding protein